MKKTILTVTAVILAVIAGTFTTADAAKSGPGPVVVTFMERAESHTDAISSRGDISGETYLYSLVSAFRKLDKNVSGNLYYMHKLSIDDGDTASHIYGLDIGVDLTGKWKGDIGFSHNTNPARGAVSTSTDSDRFSFGLGFKINPMEKKKRRWDLKTTYSTGTDFSSGTTISQKITASRSMTKHWSYAVAYQFVYGLSEATNAAGVCTICSTQYANQYYADFNFKISKKDKIGFGYLFLKNLYNGARSDDSISKISYYHTM